MRPGVRTALTMATLGVLLVVAAAWAISALTAPFPGKVDVPTCVATDVKKGEKVFPDQVVVSVYNAGTREGLAGLTMKQLSDVGFVEGESGNAPARAQVLRAQVWASDPRNPAVRLVASQFGPKTTVTRGRALGPGVVVVVGDRFRTLVRAPRKVVAAGDSSICSPPAPS
jgi:LytR cell envelope-related transcriptional attenuator